MFPLFNKNKHNIKMTQYLDSTSKYLSFEGLDVYDQLIKGYIERYCKNLKSVIDKKIEGVGEDCSENATAIVDIINLIGTIEGDNTISKLIAGLNGEISDLKTADSDLRIAINEILGADSEFGDNIASVSVISEQIKRLQSIIGQEYVGDSDDETVIERLDNLEKDSDKYKPNENLVGVDSLKSEVHGGLESLSAEDFKSKGYTYSEMFDEILFPTVTPVMTEPSLSWKEGYPRECDKAVGSNIEDLKLDINNIEEWLNINLGSWSLDINNNLKASSGYTLIDITSVFEENSIGNDVITNFIVVNFSKGEDPKNNKGEICKGKAFTSISKSIRSYIYPYYEFYATTKVDSPGNLEVQPFKRKAGIEPLETPVEITLSPHTSEHPSQLKLPSNLKTFSILNPLNGKYETVDILDNAPKMWTVGEEIMEINDISKTYYLYTYNGPDIDSLNIQITF